MGNLTIISVIMMLALSLFMQTIEASEIGVTDNTISQSGINNDIEVIEVTSKRNKENSEMTTETEILMSVPGIGNDPLSAVFSLPGIVYSGGDEGAPAVRGSSPDDNDFYIDDISGGYIFHLFGDSIFNENLIQDFRLHPAAFGSEYSNATGGVFDVKLRDPRHQEISGTVDLSMLKSGVMIEGETFEDQAFYLSYRRSQIHLFLSEVEDDEGYTVFEAPISEDYQGKYQWLIGNAHKFTFSIAGANDTAGVNISESTEAGRIDPDTIGDFTLTTQFDSQSISWQYYGEEQKLMQLTLGHTTNTKDQFYGQEQFIKSQQDKFIARFSSKVNFSADHQITFGLDYFKSDVNYSFDMIPYYCTDNVADCIETKGDRIQDKSAISNEDSALYVYDNWEINSDLLLTLGLRAEYNNFTKQKFIHPRTSLDWFVSKHLTVKAKAGTYSRFPNIDTALNKIGNPEIQSPQSQHFSLGFDYQLSSDWFTSIDVYHKELSELPRSVDEYSHENDLVLHYTNDTSGNAQGIEWLIRHELNNGWFGWASISWSQSERTDDITQITSDYYLDTPLVANVVANYALNHHWDFGLRFTLRSGAKYTPIIGLRENPDYDDHYLANYGELNSKSLPVYHRLDLEVNYKTTYFGYDAKWTWAIINAMAQENISGYYYDPSDDDSLSEYNISGEEEIGIFPYIGLKMTF